MTQSSIFKISTKLFYTQSNQTRIMEDALSKVNKLRILAIHGYRQSDATFKAKLGSLRKGFKSQIDFTFANAPHLVSPLQTASEEGTEDSKEDAGKDYGWWFNTKDRIFKATEPSDLSVGFQESIVAIEKAFQQHGPFDGIIGFSQGGAFTAILCALQQKKLSPIKFDFVIIISGFKSLCTPHAIYYEEKIDIPSLHVYGETDRIIPTEMAKELSDLFTDKVVYIHEGGHYVPGKKHIYQDFIQSMTKKES